MATVKGKYNYISEILKGTESDDTFMAGSGNEYAFGDYGVDTGLFPYGNNLILSANYYVGFGVAVILVQGKINPIDVYYLDGIEILQTLDGALDLNKIDRLVCKEYGLSYSFIETSPSSAIEGPWNEDLVYSDRFFNTFFPLGDDITIFGKTDAMNRIYINYSSENISINQRDFSTTDIYSVLNGELLQHVNGKNLNSIITTDALYSRLPTSLTWEKWGAHEGFNLMKFDLLNNLLFSVTPSATTINEIGTLTTTIETINVASGTTLYYSLSGNGINESDFSSGSLTGSGSVGSNGSFSFSHTLANDLTTEGAESLEVKLYSNAARTLQVGATAEISIVDTSITSASFNLDVDGDGKITALGDGLMIIRKLFGAAFAGDALTNKAMSPSSTRTSAEIHEFIQQGITTGLLDVDKDGKTTALGDGLMVIRHLFGAAFANEALTNKAISPDSPYFGTTANFAAVAANIDSLRPV